MKNFYFTGIILILVLFVFPSCHKGTNGNHDDLGHITKNNIAEVVSNDVFKVFLYGMIAAEDSLYHPNDSLNFHFTEPCLLATVSPNDTTTWPKTIILNYPESGCYCYDGNKRGGQVIITANGLLKTIGSKFKINLNNYSVNDISALGFKKLSVIQVSSGKPVAFNDTSGLQITSNSENITWNSVHNIEWVKGSLTETNLGDDLFIYSGTCATETFTGIITNVLQFANYCFWIGSGKIEITPTGLSKRQVTYPDSCLNQADVIINNETFRLNF